MIHVWHPICIDKGENHWGVLVKGLPILAQTCGFGIIWFFRFWANAPFAE
jgi:hypothetical protein